MLRLPGLVVIAAFSLSMPCIAREFTPCQIADPDIRASIPDDEVITIRARIFPTMHSGLALHDDACEDQSIHMISTSGSKDVDAVADAMIRAEMYDHPTVGLATGRLYRVGRMEELDAMSLTIAPGQH
jgi:hypothetical protein